MKHVVWAMVTVAAFALGMALSGAPEGPTFRSGAGDRGAVRACGPGERCPAPLPETEPAGWSAAPAAGASLEDPGHGRAAVGDGSGVVARLDALSRSGDEAAAEVLRAALFDEIRARARAGGDGARTLMAAYLDANPHDGEALLLDADLRQMQGRPVTALEPLLALLQFADDPGLVARAREKLELVVNVHEAQLANRGDLPALIRFFEDLAMRDSGYDGHRLRLARWQLRAGRPEAAAGTLAQTGLAGVDAQARADLVAEIRLARTGLPLERAGAAWHVRARVNGRPLRLLVDTGATTTAISRDRAAALGSVPTGERVRVRTAGGEVVASLHRLRHLEVGELRLDALTVLVLDHPLPGGVDGLLGMDVLSKFPGPVGGRQLSPGGGP